MEKSFRDKGTEHGPKFIRIQAQITFVKQNYVLDTEFPHFFNFKAKYLFLDQ